MLNSTALTFARVGRPKDQCRLMPGRLFRRWTQDCADNQARQPPQALISVAPSRP